MTTATTKWTPYPIENKGEVEVLAQKIIAGLSQFAGDYQQGIGAINPYLNSEYSTHLASDYLKNSEDLAKLVTLFKPQQVNALISEYPKGTKLGCEEDGCATNFVTRVESKETGASELIINYLKNEVAKTSLSEGQKGKLGAVISGAVQASCLQGRG